MAAEIRTTNFKNNIEEGHGIGTTTASYVTAVSWTTRGLKEKTIHLVNTHATASMYYKLLATYSADQTSGKEDTLVAETSLAAGEDARMTYNDEYYSLILQVVDNSGHATYEVNLNGRGA